MFSSRVEICSHVKQIRFVLSGPVGHKAVEEFSYKPGLFQFITSLFVFPQFVGFISADEAPGASFPFAFSPTKRFCRK